MKFAQPFISSSVRSHHPYLSLFSKRRVQLHSMALQARIRSSIIPKPAALARFRSTNVSTDASIIDAKSRAREHVRSISQSAARDSTAVPSVYVAFDSHNQHSLIDYFQGDQHQLRISSSYHPETRHLQLLRFMHPGRSWIRHSSACREVKSSTR